MKILDEFIEMTQSLKNLSANTLRAYKLDLNKYMLFLHNQELSHTGLANICEYINSLSKKGLKSSTIKRKIITLKLFYRYLCNEKILSANPFTEVRFPFKQEQRL